MNIDSNITDLPYVGDSYAKRLKKLDIKTVRDLLYHIPRRYIDFSKHTPISELNAGELVSIKGEVTFLKNQYTKSGRRIQMGEVKDKTGRITVLWFNQPFLTRTIYPGDRLSFSGKADWFGKRLAIVSPEYEKEDTNTHTGRLVPIYPETKGISSKWLRSRIKNAIDLTINSITETLTNSTREEVGLLTLSEAIKKIHYPKDTNDTKMAVKRLAFDELMSLQIEGINKKEKRSKQVSSKKVSINQQRVNSFISKLPFELTSSQKVSIDQILADLSNKIPMNRLLQGDVGSGKTVVAALAAYACFLNGYKTVLMAPTQILAEQHFETFSKLFKNLALSISLTTSQKSLGEGKDVAIGTQALLHKENIVKNAALIIIDEEHKFGVGQREELSRLVKDKKNVPHILTLTATPIPRTVALTLYQDQDLSTLTHLPMGRIPPKTWIVNSEKQESCYTWLKNQIEITKTQVYVICPLVEGDNQEVESEKKAVKIEYQKLKKIFSNLRVSILYGGMKNKESVVKKFRNGTIDILVSTAVVEVGIDIKNANIMVVQNAEKFGLAQLHQLRGRVGRGDKESYCILFSDTTNPNTLKRLNALKSESSGFKLAEIDLSLRGPGEIFGTKQSGIPELKYANWNDISLIKKSKEVAVRLISPSKL